MVRCRSVIEGHDVPEIVKNVLLPSSGQHVKPRQESQNHAHLADYSRRLVIKIQQPLQPFLFHVAEKPLIRQHAVPSAVPSSILGILGPASTLGIPFVTRCYSKFYQFVSYLRFSAEFS